MCRFKSVFIKQGTCTRAGSTLTSIRALCVPAIRSLPTPTSVGRKASADSVETMGTLKGTLEGPRIDLKFDGTAQGWLVFKQSMLKWTDSQNVGYMLEGGQAIALSFRQQALQLQNSNLQNSKLKLLAGRNDFPRHRKICGKGDLGRIQKTSVLTRVQYVTAE